MASLQDPVYPHIDENLLVSDAIDFNFEHNAQQPFFTYVEESSDKLTVITHLEFGRAVHRVAHLLRPNRAGPDGQVVAFVALADTIVYQAVTAALIIAGLVPFPISPRNSPEAVVNLLQKTSCHRLITTQTTLKPLLDGIKAHLANVDPHFELAVEEVPSLSDVYPKLGRESANDPFHRYPAPSVRPSVNDVCTYLHSSGSTGFPKAIPETHLAFIQWSLYPGVTEFRDHKPRLFMGCMALPPFHTLGVYMQLLNPVYGVVPISVYPPTVTSKELLPMMPSPNNILDHTRRTNANSIIIIPALLQIWSQTEEAVEYLKTLLFLGYSGGSLAPKLGDLLVESGVRLRPIYGGTEFAAPTCPMPLKGDEKEWQYMRFHERAKVRWVAQGDGTFECQLLSWENHTLMVENLPDVKGYATSDLWENHPTKKYLWKIVGRIDDVIVHSSGEKTVPAPMEDVVMSSPLVQGTVMFGREHDQTGILIEPKPSHAIDVNDDKQLAELRNKLWPIIEEANKHAPAFSRIFKEMILISAKDKPLARTGKGTVMRKLALAMYDPEIKALYETIESSTKASENVAPPATWSEADVENWLLQQAIDLTSGKDFSPSVDLFEQGIDSLSATFLRHRIVGALRSSKDPAIQKTVENLSQNTVYSYPTLQKLAAYIAGLVANPGSAANAADRKAPIEEMIAKYSSGLHRLATGVSTTRPAGAATVVLLTGSSGNLGSEILGSLLDDKRIHKIYAFNRASSADQSILERHKARFADRGLDTQLLQATKLVFVTGDTAQSNLGLDQALYDELRNSVTAIIHNAWRLDFNLSLSSFEPNVRGTRHLIDLALSGPNASTTRFLFTSSVASAQSWDKAKGPFPEEVSLDAGVAVGSGYGEGKYVAERVLVNSGLQVSSFRIGQVSGGLPKGAWATTDWVPILVKSSLALGALPQAAGVVSWLPMDAAAKAIIDVALANQATPPPVALNLVHPRPVLWNLLIDAIKDALKREKGRDLRLVPFHDWFSQLEKKAAGAGEKDMAAIPAIKLLEFFRGVSQANAEIAKSGKNDIESGGLVEFATVKMRDVSPTVGALRQLDANDVGRWIKYWNEAGFLGDSESTRL